MINFFLILKHDEIEGKNCFAKCFRQKKGRFTFCSIFDERSGNRPAGNSFTRSKSPWWIFSIVLNSCILVVSVKLIYWWAASVASWWTFVMQLMRGRPMAILLKTIFCLTSEKKTQCHVEANVHTDVRDCFFFLLAVFINTPFTLDIKMETIGSKNENHSCHVLLLISTFYLCYDQRKIKYIIKRIIFDTITTK